MISTLFAYDGWQFVSFVAGEIRDPQRNLPRSIILGVFIVIVIYVSANLAYIYVLGQPRIAASERVAADAMCGDDRTDRRDVDRADDPLFDLWRDLGQRAGGAAGVLRDGAGRVAVPAAGRGSTRATRRQPTPSGRSRSGPAC